MEARSQTKKCKTQVREHTSLRMELSRPDRRYCRYVDFRRPEVYS